MAYTVGGVHCEWCTLWVAYTVGGDTVGSDTKNGETLSGGTAGGHTEGCIHSGWLLDSFLTTL